MSARRRRSWRCLLGGQRLGREARGRRPIARGGGRESDAQHGARHPGVLRDPRDPDPAWPGVQRPGSRGAPLAVVLSRSAAQHYWPDDDPIGKRLVLEAEQEHTLTVVGLVPDTRYRDLRDARPSIYFPLGQSFFPVTPSTLAIGTDGRPAELVSTIRRVISETEPGVALADAAAFETFLEGPLAQPRLNAFLLVLFAGAAVTLAAVGLFGVMVTMVRHRTQELGIRLALGAKPRDLRQIILRRGLAIGAAGLVPDCLVPCSRTICWPRSSTR